MPVTLDEAISRYNQHPEVQAQGGKMTVSGRNYMQNCQRFTPGQGSGPVAGEEADPRGGEEPTGGDEKAWPSCSAGELGQA